MTDRRVQKTLQALHQALMDLIVERGYDALTVKDIIDRANVGRSTFYAHYLGKEQLLQGGLDQLGKALAAHQRGLQQQAAAPFAFSLALFEHAQGYRKVFRAMLGRHAGTVVASRLQQVLARVVDTELNGLALPEDLRAMPRPALNGFIVGALMAVLSWWVDAPPEASPADVDAIFRRLALAGGLAGAQARPEAGAPS